MDAPSNEPKQSRPPFEQPMPFMSIVSALLFLYVGFGMGLTGISGNALYDGSVWLFTWAAKVVGIGLLVVAGFQFMRLRGANLLDLIMACIATIGCVVPGAIWLVFGDMTGVLILAFGLFNANAARAAWMNWKMFG